MWDISSSIGSVGDKRDGTKYQYFRLWIRSTEELKRLLRLVAPHVHQLDMLYKVLILYKDSELQQRWISEIAELSELTIKDINLVVNQRKSQLKNFQKKI